MRASLPFGKQDKEFQKKPQLALSLVDRSLASGERPGIVLIDAGYGNNTTFLKELENRQLKYLGGIAKNRKVKIEKQDKSLAEIRVDKWAESLSDEAFTQIEVKLDKAKHVWVATRQVELPGQSGKRTIAIVMNAKNFNDASDIDYFITNVESEKATGEWFVKTYSQRNWVEVFYREAKGWLGLKEYQVRDARSLMRHFMLVFCAYTFILWHTLTGGLRRKWGDETFKHFCRSFVGLSNSHILSICLVDPSELGRVCCLQKEFGLCWRDFCYVHYTKVCSVVRSVVFLVPTWN
jgi:SRSO17 transposase